MEKPTYDVWTRQLRGVLVGQSCGPGVILPVPLPAKPQPASVVEDQPGPDSQADLIPLSEIHDFNQLARDRWVQAKAQSVPAGARVLDVGAGTCLYRELFAHCDYKTHDFAQYEGVKHGGGTGYGHIDYVSDILAIPVPDASFDVILCTEVLEHVPEPIKVLEEIARILRPGGRAFVTAPLGSHLHQLPFHFYGGYTPEWYKRFGAACGLNPIEITPNGGFFKHLAQECARAAYMYSQQTDLHGSDAGEIHKLLSDSMPRFFFELDDKCFDEKCTVGFQVEFVKTAQSPQTDGAHGAKAQLAPVSVRPEAARPEAAQAGNTAMTHGGEAATVLDEKSVAAGPPVVVKLMGGLGNQMFEYAAGLAVARKRGVPLKLDLSFLLDRTSRPNFAYRDFDLDLFCLAPDCELIRETHHLPQGLRSVPEKHFHYDSSVTESPAGIYLDGYWQSPRYFESVLDEVRKTFSSFATVLNAENQKLADEIASNNAVCLHVRRADMVADPVTAAFHGSCDILYFQEASALISKRHPDAHYFVFSDDIEWCRDSGLLAGHPHTFIEHRAPGNHTGVDLQLMMLCRHFIISNSTYGWWAAYLSSSENRTVVMPEPWFSDSSKETTDLVPKGWIRLSRQPGPLPVTFTSAPTVSLIIPCYNQAHFLPEAVASVVAQTYSGWEIIIVNDGSPDDTSRVAQELIELYPGRRIRLLEKSNGGLADARNAGIKESRGRYILPLDSDDKIHPQMLEKTLAVLETQPGISIVYTDLLRFGEVSGVLCAGEYDFARLCQQNQMNCCALYRRKIWETVGGYNPNMRWGYEDWDFWIGCGKRGFVGQRLGEPLFFYRTKPESMVTMADSHGDELRAQIVQNHPELYTPEVRNWAAKVLPADQQAESVQSELLAAPSKPELQAASEEQPLISVIVPCYNQAEYLTSAVESVVAQTYSHWEIIVVNDGSTDPSREAGRQLQARFPAHRIRLVEKENGGLADARNAGIRFAKGEYILPLDADDMIAPDFLEKTVRLLEGNPQIAIAYTDWVYFGAMEGRRNAIDWDARHLCEKENLFTCTSLFRKAAWDCVNGYNTNMTKGVEDWDFWISCAEKGYVGQRIPEALFYYRAKGKSMITEVQPFVPVMFARIILNHPKLYAQELVEKAKIIFDSANLPPPKPSSLGREWLPDETMRDASSQDLIPAITPEDWASKLSGKRLLLWADVQATHEQLNALRLLAEELRKKNAEVHFACSAAALAVFSEDERGFVHEVVAGLQDKSDGAPKDTDTAGPILEEVQADLIVFFDTALFASQDAKQFAMDGFLPFICCLLGWKSPVGLTDCSNAGGLRKLIDYSCFTVVDSEDVREDLVRTWGIAPWDVRVLEAARQGGARSDDPGRLDESPFAILELLGRAISQTNQELAIRKMNALVRSGEILALLAGYRESLESPVVLFDGAATELPEFPPAEVDMIQGLVTSWKERPQDEAQLAQLRQLRQSVSSYLASARDEDAGRLMSGSFGIVYRTLLESGLQDELPTPEEEGVAEFLTGGFDEKGDFSFLRLLAFMLFRRAHRSPALYALDVLPKWFLRDYIGWVFSAPAALVENEEAGSYTRHLAGWLREILRRISQNSAIGLPLADVNALVLERLNLIPVYCSGQSTRELMEARARLLEHSLSSAGADLDGPQTKRVPPARGKRIRIGILNAHFGLQTETFVTLPAFHLDRSRFDVFLFAGFANPGDIESHCRQLADHFTVLPSALPEQVRIIRDAKLDAIIVGTNITAVTNGMSLLAAHRLAPVQILSHCSPMTSGFRNMDGFLSGSLAYRSGASEAEFSEKLVLLDGPPVCLDYATQPAPLPGPGDRAKFGLLPDEFLFLNAASCFKIPVELMDAWAQILQQVPNSRLLLMPFNPNWSNKFPQAQFERALKRCLRNHGVAKNQVILSAPFTSRAQVMELEKMADLYLDTMPFSGSISTVDPLELGIPVVACDGKTTRSRCSGALLREIGIPELVAQDTGEYIRIAVSLAQNADIRSSLSTRIRMAMSKKPRFLDPDAYGRQLSEVLEGIVRRGWGALPVPPQTSSLAAQPNPLLESVDQSFAMPALQIPAIDLEAHSPMQIMHMARTAFAAKNWAFVEDLCRHLLTRAPDTAAAWALLAELARRSGDLDYAAELMDQALELDPDNVDFWSTLGEIRRDKKDLDGALVAFQRAVELRPDFPNAWLMLALVHDERKDAAEAEKAYAEAVCYSKDRVEIAQIRVNFAGFLRDQKRIKEGIKQLRKAVSSVPDSSETLLLLGSFLQEGGDLDDA
ncbi:MAG: glycosyltransferase, partial [Phycisphaerae bacterium]